MGYHRLLTGDNLHSLQRWEFADETARLAVAGATSADIGKVARQLDDDSFWILTSDSPVIWAGLTSAGDSSFEHRDGNFTAEAFGKYAVDVSEYAMTIQLPASPSEGDWFEFYDATADSDTNTITIQGNGNNIMGAVDDITVTTAGLYFKIVYFNVAGGYRIMRLV